MSDLKSGQLLGGRYRIETTIGMGGMGALYRAYDLRDGTDVAVKVLRPGAEKSDVLVHRFEREIETLRRIAHPDILHYLDHGTHETTLYLVTEFIHGRTLQAALPEFLGRADKVLLLGARLARAFAAAHAQGMVHRDIKPSNIMLTDTGDVRILDYGLARWDTPEGESGDRQRTITRLTESNVLLGTVIYMSPEQLRGERADRRSDIFSLAVMLFELASGRRPFEAPAEATLLAAMEAGRFPSLEQCEPRLGGPLGAALDALLRRALTPAVQDRYHDMSQFADALERALDLGEPGLRDRSVALLLPPPATIADRDLCTMVGRGEELGLVEEALAGAKSGTGCAILIAGPRGIGKSTLANEAVRAAHRQGFLCLTAVAHLAEQEQCDAPIHVWLRRVLELFPNDPEIARAAESVLEARAAFDPGPAAGDAGVRDQTLAVLLGLLAKGPLLLLLEDLHFAPPSLVELLETLAASAAGQPLVLILTARTDMSVTGLSETALKRLTAMTGLRRIALEPLGAGDIRQIAEELYPGLLLGDATLVEIHRRSGGNPSYCRQILKLLEEQTSLRRVGLDWELDARAVTPFPPEARAILEHRLEGMDPVSKEILEAAVILGSSFEPSRLCEVTGLDSAQVATLLDTLSESRRLLVRERDGYRFDQALTHELLLARMSQEKRSALHFRAASTLSARLPAEPDIQAMRAVVHHFVQARRPEEALPFIERMALHLCDRQAPRDAIPWLEQAIEILEHQTSGPEGEEARRARDRLAELQLALGESLVVVGRHAEAINHLDRARGLARDTGRGDLEARALRYQSQTFFALGEFLQAQRKASESGRAARKANLEGERALALSAEAQALSRSDDNERAEELWTEATRTLEAIGQKEKATEILLDFGIHLFHVDRFDAAEERFLEAARRVDKERDPRLYTRIVNARAAVILARGRPAEALPLFEESASLRRRIGFKRGEAISLHNIAHCHHKLGNLQQARRMYGQVAGLRQQIGDEAGRASAQNNLAEVLLDLGRVEEALEHAAGALASMKRLEDRTHVPFCLVLHGEVELELGRPQRAREFFAEVLRDYPSHPVEAFKASMGLAQADLQTNQVEAARRRFDQLVEGLGACSDRLDDLQARYGLASFHQSRRAGLDQIRRIAAPALDAALGETLPAPALFLALIRSIVAIVEGRREDARSDLREALEIAEAMERVELIWRIHRDLGRLEAPGTEARAAANRRAIDIITRQAQQFHQDELRRAYVGHCERAELLGPDTTNTRSR